MNTLEKVTPPNKEYRHVRLHDEIKEMSRIIRRLNDFKDRLMGAPSPVEEQSKPDSPSFMVVLCEGPDLLFKIREECMGIIDDIENMLF